MNREMHARCVFYFARHGETDCNRRGIVQGRQIDAGLNAMGQAQAARLADRFAGVPLDAIYASTLRRATETAACIASLHPNAPLRLDPDLAEMSWGRYEGRVLDDRLRARFEGLATRWKLGDPEARPDGGESAHDVQTRALRAVNRIRARHPGQTVLVVTHGRFLRILLATLLPDYGIARMDDIPHANTGVYKLIARGEAWRAEYLNCTRHLYSEDCVPLAGPSV